MIHNIRFLTIVAASALTFTACLPAGDRMGEEKAVTQADLNGMPQEYAAEKDENMEKNEPMREEDENAGLSSGAKMLCGSYFKAGDYRYGMTISPGGPFERENLSVALHMRIIEADDAVMSDYGRELQEFHFAYASDKFSYEISDGTKNGGLNTRVYINQNGTVTLEGVGESDGVYYLCRGNLMLPDGFERPLNQTDLIGFNVAEMRIIRNQFYAVYGRKFRSKELNEYFKAMPWYVGTAEDTKFDERLLSGLMKRNIAFLKAAEEEYDEEQAAMLRREYEALLPAPYQDVLPQSDEILVNIPSIQEGVQDHGLYYIAQGMISVPITFTAEQYQSLEKGEELLLITDELTGASAVLKKALSENEGEYLLGDANNEEYVMSAYHPESGVFSLWSDSVDTKFKRVYQGDIYVLKGASEEYYGHFYQPQKEAAGLFRVMDFEETDAVDSAPYMGNILVRDGKGYVKALYFRGD